MYYDIKHVFIVKIVIIITRVTVILYDSADRGVLGDLVNCSIVVLEKHRNFLLIMVGGTREDPQGRCARRAVLEHLVALGLQK